MEIIAIIKPALIRIQFFLANQLGFDLLRFVGALRGLPHFLKTWCNFRKGYAGTMVLMPCLYDRYQEGGTTKSEYFWQDLLVARWIYAANPKCHVDIGSRVDGFIAHLAAFREVEVFDIRPINTTVPGVIFRQADIMSLQTIGLYSGNREGYCDSLSCLHALEHFGLGRYGDPVDPKGYQRGISSMSSLLISGGVLYLSVPIGIERVEFNSHRVFDPRELIVECGNYGLSVESLTVVSPDAIVSVCDLKEASLAQLARKRYTLGIFTLKKQ